jgi:hypothetical protein
MQSNMWMAQGEMFLIVLGAGVFATGLNYLVHKESAGIPMVITVLALGYKAPLLVGTLSFLLLMFAIRGTFSDKFWRAFLYTLIFLGVSTGLGSCVSSMDDYECVAPVCR